MKFAIFASVLLCICHTWLGDARTSRIIGGQTANAGQFPFSAILYIDKALGRYFCGGGLISNQWILTAGQCVDGATLFTIEVGSTNLQKNDPNRKRVTTSDYVLHPNYNSETLENDVGLIKLRLPILYDDYVQRILLAYDYTSDNTVLTAIGWGQTSDCKLVYDTTNDENDRFLAEEKIVDGLSEDLQYVTLAAISNDECKLVFGNQISDAMICVAGEYNEGTCIGDTGSPLVDNDPISRSLRHVGIASFISGNGCESTDPSGYTKTYAFRDWIRNITSL